MTEKKIDVLGIGNPLIDIFVQVSDEQLNDLKLEKNTMTLVDAEQQTEILEKTAHLSQTTSIGGSCGNSIIMLAQLGSRVAFAGKIGEDRYSEEIEANFKASNILSYLKKHPSGLTGKTIILVTPDASRTMNTYLGSAQAFSSSDIDKNSIAQSRYIYIEGYLWDTDSQKQAVEKALEIAKETDTKIAFSLSDPFCVNRHKDDFNHLLPYIDVLFCNEEEGRTLTDKEIPGDMVKEIAGKVEEVIVTLGESGSFIKKDDSVFYMPAVSVDAVDTTGAGDSFAAGYLFGLLNEYSSIDCAKIATSCASHIVKQIGARYQGDLRQTFNNL